MRDAHWRVAMMSVYFHARFGEGDWMPAEMRPIPLDDAVRILRDDDAAFATARRRRAIAKLYTSPMRERFRPQIEALGAPLTRLESRFHLLDGLPDGDVSIGEVVSFLEGLIAPAPEECKRTFPKSDVSFDVFSSTTDANLELTVERDLDSMRSVADPQNWSTCGAKYWAASYPINDLGTGPINWKAYPPQLSSPPAPGTTWSSPFFEHLLIDWGGQDVVQFRVELAIDSKKAPLSHQFDYSLKRSIMSGLGPIEQEGGIAIDSGKIRAEAATAAGPTSLSATKKFKVAGFGKQPVDFFANLWASIALEQMADETYESVCCRP